MVEQTKPEWEIRPLSEMPAAPRGASRRRGLSNEIRNLPPGMGLFVPCREGETPTKRQSQVASAASRLKAHTRVAADGIWIFKDGAA